MNSSVRSHVQNPDAFMQNGIVSAKTVSEDRSIPRHYHAASFRDSAGRVFETEAGVYRTVDQAHVADWFMLRESRFFQGRQTDGSLVRTSAVDEATHRLLADTLAERSLAPLILQHERLAWISYPYEWTFSMLQSAAVLQLELLRESLTEQIILKDATPYNIQFRGCQPIFIDIGSFTRYTPGTPWTAYRQFCMQFLYPLLLQAYRDIDFQPWLRGSLQGITPGECRRWFGWSDVWRRGLLWHVFAHAAFDRSARVEEASVSQQLRDSGFNERMIARNIEGLLKLVRGLKWQPASSRWSRYDAPEGADDPVIAAKESFIHDIAASRAWGMTWDLGCNAGRYSRIVAPHSQTVIAMDFDHATIDRLYRELQANPQQNRIIPLRINLADPSPGLGWRGRERSDLSTRGRPDLVLCLAVIHHLVLAENIPLPEIMAWLGSLGGAVVIEFVDRNDPQVQRLLAQRSDAGHAYSIDDFEDHLRRHFTIRCTSVLPGGTRTLYFAEPRHTASLAG